MGRASFLLILLALSATGCESALSWQAWDGKTVATHVFGEPPPDNLTILHADAETAGGEYPNDWWESHRRMEGVRLDLLAPPGWIEAIVSKYQLVRVPVDNEQVYYFTPSRSYHPGWFVPPGEVHYWVYASTLREYPSLLMFVDPHLQSDGRQEVFVAVW